VALPDWSIFMPWRASGRLGRVEHPSVERLQLELDELEQRFLQLRARVEQLIEEVDARRD